MRKERTAQRRKSKCASESDAAREERLAAMSPDERAAAVVRAELNLRAFRASVGGKQKLTEVEAETLQAIVTLQSNLGYSPCVRDIAAVRKRAVNTIQEGLDRLEAKGWIIRDLGRPRTIRVL